MSISIKYIGQNIENIGRREANVIRKPIPKFTPQQIKDFKPIFKFLNKKDRDILFLHFVNNKKQHSIQEILNRSQPSLCYDIKRIKKRVKFIHYLNSTYDIFLKFIDEPPKDFNKEAVDILIAMFYTSSLTQSSNILNVRQIRVRYIFDKCIEYLEENKMWQEYEIFLSIRSNLNIIKRTYKGENIDDKLDGIFLPL